jgi:uncharacterized protein (TIGR03437 family)
MRYRLVILIGGMVAPLAAQSPSINSGGVVNAASQAAPGLPNSAIAQGSIFAINGRNLGPPVTQQNGSPLTTSVAGMSAQVTVNGTSMPAPIVSASANQVLAIMPSGMPAGNGTVSVKTAAGTSAQEPLEVTTGSFGIYTVNGSANGPAMVTDANGNPVTLTSPAQPSQTVTVSGTGFGALSADDISAPVMQDISSSVAIYVGVEPAVVHYAGRSGNAPGQDVITFDIPPDAAAGCYVALYVVFNGITSNFTSTSIAPDGVACSDSNGFSSAQIQQIQQLVASGSNVRLASINLTRATQDLPPALPPFPSGMSTTDSAAAEFLEYTPRQLAGSVGFLQSVSLGGCLVFTFSGNSMTATDPVQAAGLDAGTITISGPKGAKQLTTVHGVPGYYSGTLGSTQDGGGLYLDPGTYTITGTGGTGTGAVDPFTATIDLPPPITWTNAADVSVVNRSSGATVNWTGGDPHGFVYIVGVSIAISTAGGTFSGVGGEFFCTAPANAGTFTVPGAVTLALPPTGSIPGFGSGSLGSLSMASWGQFSSFTAPGIDMGFVTASSGSSQRVTFQ